HPGAGNEGEIEARGHRPDHQLHHDRRQPGADAAAWPTTEGKVGEAGPALRVLWREAFGVEPFRRLPDIGTALRHERTQQDGRPDRNPIAADPGLVQWGPGRQPRGRVESKDLLD